MKCPNCDTVNAKTNKYCRQCGTRLDVLVSREPEPVSTPTADDVGLGEELFAVLELFEHGDLDAALGKSHALVSDNPNSASAHSIVALIYERKAENALAQGNPDGARDFLKRAIQHYEAIIDLNPDSAADREKLVSLRLRHTGHEAPLKPQVSFGPGVDSKRSPLGGVVQRVRSVPRPALAAAGALVAVVILVVAVTGLSGGTTKKNHASKRHEKPVAIIMQTQPGEPALRVYTFPQENPSAEAPLAPTPAVATPAAPPSFAGIKPLKVPKIDQELTLVPDASGKSEPAPAKQPAKTVEDSAPAKPTGDSLLAKSIRLRNQGSTSEAIGAANQAIVLYRADIDVGKNPDSANRGIATATKYISVWQASLASSSE